MDDSVGAEGHALERVVVREHCENDIALACLSNPLGALRAELNQGASLLRRAVVDRQLVPCPEQPRRHPRAHQSQSYESDPHRAS